MSDMNNGGPAFPRIDEMDKDARGGFTVSSTDGMTLRQYFAAAAIQGLMANPSVIDALNSGAFNVLVSAAVATADMLLERTK